MSVSIQYGDEHITFTKTGEKTILNCSDKIMNGNIIVYVPRNMVEVSGTLIIDKNGEVDVTNYKKAEVRVDKNIIEDYIGEVEII